MLVDDVRLKLLEGKIGLLAVGAVVPRTEGLMPFVVVGDDGAEIEDVSLFLRDLVLSDMSPWTVRSYGNDLLRWWRILGLLGIPWEQATRSEVEILVGWMRSAVNPQRRGTGQRAGISAQVNVLWPTVMRRRRSITHCR
uniref:hypothetical protein n=1 Tax=Paenarthrobacter ureafaciens TaxID=37931 RepID=UPI003F49ADCD